MVRPVTDDDIGLKMLREAPAEAAQAIDIVAIHGIGAHPDDTWCKNVGTAENPRWVNWLDEKDMLPAAAPNARIMRYGYQSQWFGEWAMRQYVSRVAQRLLLALGRKRKEYPFRPLIFIAHCFGGLVVLKALLEARHDIDEWPGIFDSTTGLLFFGTPFRGAEGMSQMEMLEAARREYQEDEVQTDVLKVLEPGNEFLREVVDQFCRMRRQANKAKVACFYELKSSNVGKIVGKQDRTRFVVSAGSGCLDPSDRTSKFSLSRTHFDMNKFGKPTEEDFETVRDVVEKMIRESPGLMLTRSQSKEYNNPIASTPLSERNIDCLRSLSFLEQEQRYKRIETARDTCQWLLEDSGYRAWTNNSRGLFWIKGNPGAGKSVLMKFAVTEMRRRQSGELVLSFFIHGQGTKLQKTPLGIYRALLNSMLEDFPKYLAQLTEIYEDREKRFGGYMADKWKWSDQELQDFLSNVLTTGSKYQPVVIFIDALDECGENSARSLFAYFKDLMEEVESEGSQVKICVSSRHYPILGVDTIPSISVEERNRNDIESVIRTRLKKIEPHSKRNQIQEAILSKAQGGFQWAVLVTALVIDGNTTGKRVEKLHEMITSTPPALDNLYANILSGFTKAEKDQMIKLFQWVLFAKRPLSRQELREALATDKDMTATTVFEVRCHESWTETLFEFERHVKHISRGLVEFQTRDVYEYEPGGEDPDREAKFIHSSVADYLQQNFLRKDKHHQNVSPSCAGAGHFEISRSCLRYLALREVLEAIQLPRGAFSARFPLVPYATRFVFEHIRKVEQQGIPQPDLLMLFQWDVWSESLGKVASLWTVFDPNKVHTPIGWPFVGTTALHFLTALGSKSALDTFLLEHDVNVGRKDLDGNTPLLLAIKERYQDIALILLQRTQGDDLNLSDKNGMTPLSWAAETGQDVVVKPMLDAEAVEIDLKDACGWSPLCRAARKGYEVIVKLLLETGKVDVDSRSQDGRTALSWAAGNGHKAVVKLLLETRKVDPDAKDNDGRTSLSLAAASGHETVVKLLLKTGKVDPDAKDDDGRTPLSYATAQGHNAVIKLLVDLQESRSTQPRQIPGNQLSDEHREPYWDGSSDISDISSVFSMRSIGESESSIGSIGDMSLKASEHLADMLANDADLSTLYTDALATLDPARFLRNHNRLLKIFFHELSLEIQLPLQLRTVQSLNHRSLRVKVSDLIRTCFDLSNSQSHQIMNSFREQRPDRQHALNRYLAVQTSEPEISSDSIHTATMAFDLPVENDSENDLTDDERENNDAEHPGNTEFDQLDLIMEFLTKGAAFDRFKAGLRRFIRPFKTLDEAMEHCDLEFLRNFLTQRFDVIARDELPWLHELEEVGYTHDEIAALLFEHNKDTPWVYFDPQEQETSGIEDGFHLQRCVHQNHSKKLTTLPRIPEPIDERDIRRSIQELCGLAGVAPVSRNQREWNGTVRFEDDNSTAIVSYTVSMGDSHLGISENLLRVKNAVTGFSKAVGLVQKKGLCCDSFTVLTKTRNLSQEKTAHVELWRLRFRLAMELSAEIDRLLRLDQITTPEVGNTRTIAGRILEPLELAIEKGTAMEEVDCVLHSCSLAVQFLCLGFLSYIQAHIGPIQPFFLDTPQRKVLLLGNGMADNYAGAIMAELVDLTCVASMTEGPVLAFGINHGPSEPRVKHDLVASAEDLLDTWGPGRLIYQEGDFEHPCAIIIGGGVIHANDPTGEMFHWSHPSIRKVHYSTSFDRRTKITIGALIKVNKNCAIDEKKCWLSSCSALLPLGPTGNHWEADERQGGIQTGQYIIGQFNQTWHKFKGKTLKDYQLEQEDDLLLPLLEAMWGLQISFCTSIARRVSLQELVADVLPIFAKTLFCQPNLWDDLKANNIMDAFQKPGLMEWIKTLSAEQQSYVLRLIRRILTILQPTGVDRTGKNLKIAWPQEGDVQRGFVLPCENQSFWARLVADSEDCATFAYVSPKCLESETVKCNGSSPVWKNSSILLETGVINHQSIPDNTAKTLEHRRWYFVKKPDTLYLVKVHKPEGASSTRLITSPSPMPQAFQHRMFWKEEWRKNCRLRERQSRDEPAEMVVVLASKGFRVRD